MRVMVFVLLCLLTVLALFTTEYSVLTAPRPVKVCYRVEGQPPTLTIRLFSPHDLTPTTGYRCVGMLAP